MPDDPPPMPIGQPEPRTDADLDRLAAVTDADVAEAVAFWRENVPPKWRNLIVAEPMSP